MYKCTFIILSRDIYDETGGNEIASMIGDTNLFLQKPDSNRPTEHCAESGNSVNSGEFRK